MFKPCSLLLALYLPVLSMIDTGILETLPSLESLSLSPFAVLGSVSGTFYFSSVLSTASKKCDYNTYMS